MSQEKQRVISLCSMSLKLVNEGIMNREAVTQTYHQSCMGPDIAFSQAFSYPPHSEHNPSVESAISGFFNLSTDYIGFPWDLEINLRLAIK